MERLKSLMTNISNFIKPPPPPPPPPGYIQMTWMAMALYGLVSIIIFLVVCFFITQIEQATGWVSQFIDSILSIFYGNEYTRWDRRSGGLDSDLQSKNLDGFLQDWNGNEENDSEDEAENDGLDPVHKLPDNLEVALNDDDQKEEN